MKRPLVAIVLALLLVAAGVLAGTWWAHRGMHGATPATASAAPAQPERRVLYWHDPMYPQQKFDKPGKSPFMDMDLVPVYADEGAGEAGGVQVSPQLAQNLGVRSALAERGRLASSSEALGTVAFDERAVALVQARSAGFVEELYVRAPLDPVRAGQPLLRLFVPEWAGAQHEYLALRGQAGMEDLARAARSRLLLLGMTEAQVAAVERDGKPSSSMTLTAPIGGVVAELGARQGMNVAAGATLFRINGLDSVWINVEIPERQAASVRPGEKVTATVAAWPGERFSGRIAAVLPEVNATTRTVRARVEVDNTGGKLKPGMFANVAVASAAPTEAVLVPSEALIPTGERTVIVVDRGEGRYEPVEVRTGREEAGRTEIISGIEAGTRVVVSGQFLIDSEASLRGVERRMEAPK